MLSNSKEITSSNDLMEAAIRRYREGDSESFFELIRSDGHIDRVAVKEMRSSDSLDALDRLAITRCRGRVLEVGAGMGRHTEHLLRAGLVVTPIDISNECISYLKNVVDSAECVDVRSIKDFRSITGVSYDTVLLLGNGIGMFSSIVETEAFFGSLSNLLEDDGVLLCDSVDVEATGCDALLRMREENRNKGRFFGQVDFHIRYESSIGREFSWLYFTEREFRRLVEGQGLFVEILDRKGSGRYLAAVTKHPVQTSVRSFTPGRQSTLTLTESEDVASAGVGTRDSIDANGYIVLNGLISKDVAALMHRCALMNLESKDYFIDDRQTGCPSKYADASCEALMDLLKPQIEKVVGERLHCTYSYIRFYRPGSELSKHRDRPACEVSLTVTLGYSAESVWPIYVESSGKEVGVELDVGDAMLYKGIEVTHWREKFAGSYWLQVFVHYVKADGDHKNRIYDGRYGVGPER